MAQIFVSHASGDAEMARALRAMICAARPGDAVLLSSQQGAGPAGGTSWRAWITNSIANCDLVIFIASANSLSVWCSAELGMALLLNKRVLPFHTGDLDAVNQLIDVQVEPLDQPPGRIVALIDAILGAPGRVTPGKDFDPYPGLNPLTQEQAGFLFGRDDEIRRVMREFAPDGPGKLVMLTGPSGSGKSSLARAGLIPELRDAGWAVNGPWQPKQLASGALPTPAAYPGVVIVDQAEELVLVEPAARDRIVLWLRSALDDGIWALLAVRSEFRSELGRYLPKPIDHYVPFLSRDDLYPVIRKPAKLANLRIDEELVDRLVGQTGSGEALPLLALTLHELWKRRDPVTNALTAAALADLGGVQGVMARLAEDALHTATGGDSHLTDAVLAVLTRLADPSRRPPTRSPIRVDSLVARHRAWLDEFAAVGLVTYRTSYSLDDRLDTWAHPTGDDLADVTHEEIFGWAPLARAIDSERERNLERQSIERSAREWDDDGRADSSLLLAGDRLRSASAQDLETSDSLLRDYISSSRRKDRDRRIRAAATALTGVASVVIAVLLYFVIQQRDAAQTAEAQAKSAERTARSLRMVAQSKAAINNDRDFALLAAVAAHREAPSADSLGVLMEALAAPDGPVRYFTDDRAEWSTLRTLDEGRGLVSTPAGAPHVVDFTSGEMTRVGRGSDLDSVMVVDMELVPHSQSALFRGQHAAGGWAIGVWDFTSREGVLLRHPREIRAAAAAGSVVVFGDSAGGVYAGDLTRTPPGASLVDRHPTSVTAIDLSRDGARLVSASAGGVHLVPASESGWGDPVELLATSPGGPTPERVAFRRDPAGPVGEQTTTYEVLAAGSDPVVRRWRVGVDGRVQASRLGRHPGPVAAIAVAPEDPVLMTAGMEGTVQRWDLTTGAARGDPRPGHDERVGAISVHDATHFITTAGAEAIVWDLEPARSIQRAGVLPPQWNNEPVAALVEGPGPLTVVTDDKRKT